MSIKAIKKANFWSQISSEVNICSWKSVAAKHVDTGVIVHYSFVCWNVFWQSEFGSSPYCLRPEWAPHLYITQLRFQFFWPQREQQRQTDTSTCLHILCNLHRWESPTPVGSLLTDNSSSSFHRWAQLAEMQSETSYKTTVVLLREPAWQSKLHVNYSITWRVAGGISSDTRSHPVSCRQSTTFTEGKQYLLVSSCFTV